MNFKPVTHVIFDMDGLIINTEDLYEAMFNKIIGELKNQNDYKVPYEIKCKVMGRKPLDALEIYVEELDIPASPEDILKLSYQNQPDFFSKAELLPGAERLINHLYKNDIPMAICTGSSEEAFDNKTKNKPEILNLFQHMKHILKCGSDPRVKNGKPAADPYLVAKSLFDVEPEASKCLAFEDSPLGLESALNAGMQCVMVPDTRLPEAHREKATVVCNSLLDFKPELFGLPKFED